MLNPDEIGRIADAVVAIRPEWPVGQVADYLEKHARRPFPVLAAAAVFVATTPLAKNLAALEVDGHWWIAQAEPRTTDPRKRKSSLIRDDAWWAHFALGQQSRASMFGYPKTEDAETTEPAL